MKTDFLTTATNTAWSVSIITYSRSATYVQFQTIFIFSVQFLTVPVGLSLSSVPIRLPSV